MGDVFTVGPQTSLRAADMLRAKMYVPIHHGTFPPIDTAAWARSFEEKGHRARVLAPGETHSL